MKNPDGNLPQVVAPPNTPQEHPGKDEERAPRAKLNSTAILVLGMHRSGTSAAAGVLHRIGVDLGPNLMPPAPDNPKGFYEHKEIQVLNDLMLSLLDYRWDDPRSLPENWIHDPRLEGCEQELEKVLIRDFAGKPLWGVKAPRLCRLLPFWLPMLKKLHVTPKAILVVRAPGEVAASLARRNEMAADHALLLWLSHTLESEAETRQLPRAVLLYEDLLHDWKREVKKVKDTLHLALPALSARQENELDAFLTQELRHHKEVKLDPSTSTQAELALRVYEALKMCAREGTDPKPLMDEITCRLRLARQAARPFEQFMLGRVKRSSNRMREAQSELEEARARLEHMQILLEQIRASIVWKGAMALRKRRTLAKRQPPCLKPHRQLEQHGTNLWEATGNDPQFLIEGENMAPGWYCFQARLEPLEPLPSFKLDPMLYPDEGNGFRSQKRVMPSTSREGFIHGHLLVTAETRRIRFDPMTVPGKFCLSGFRFQPMEAFITSQEADSAFFRT